MRVLDIRLLDPRGRVFVVLQVVLLEAAQAAVVRASWKEEQGQMHGDKRHTAAAVTPVGIPVALQAVHECQGHELETP
jgi:hypothetical protein